MKKIFSIFSLSALGIYAFLKQPKFGRKPTGRRLERIKESPNYRNGQFQNLSPTPSFTEGATYFTVIKKLLFEKAERREPSHNLPSMKTNLLNLDPKEDVLVWFGHSSYFLQVDGKKILTDPLFSGSASPLPTSRKAFKGTNRYSPADMPAIDFLFVTHDHWDHLDYGTITGLKGKIGQIITGLGVGAHFERWGFSERMITELDWNQSCQPTEGFTVHAMPARHFSGRGLKRNTSLWVSFVLKTPGSRIYIGGDSGYDTHFRKIGKEFGPFDLTILENGQYNRHWKYLHMMPEETLQAAKDLRAKNVLPVHNSKFNLANHPWDEPLRKITDLQVKSRLRLLTPVIGEKVDLKDRKQQFSRWWEGLE